MATLNGLYKRCGCKDPATGRRGGGGAHPQPVEQVAPHVSLTVVTSHTRSLTRPIVDYVRAVDAGEEHDRLVVLIPEMQLPRPWELLQNQRGAVLDRALPRYTDAVICRLRFRIDVPR